MKGNKKIGAKTAWINWFFRPAILLLATTMMLVPSCQQATNNRRADMKARVPDAIKREHEELHRVLNAAMESGGATGEAAQVVAKRLDEHFRNEERYALPPLGLLPEAAYGYLPDDLNDVIDRSETLKRELPQMLIEHKGIVVALDDLARAAENERKPDAIEFVHRLKLHAQHEEEVLYPAAILVGEYLKLRTRQ